PESIRTRLTAVINRWASGPDSLAVSSRIGAPAIPSCQLPSLPDLTLDDETDPPVQIGSEVRLQPAAGASPDQAEPREAERRSDHRGRFESPVVVEKSPGGPVVLIGRDLAPGGMRVERTDELRLADRFRIALYGPGSVAPFIVEAEVIRDDGEDGFALAFLHLDPQTSREIEKLVACLPDVESLEDGEINGMGAILSKILRG
ncbi:MAG: PilZ domain-containing protein, partial [Deltaproteobacteria bacterium]|nr:PilZ domain-containing protein [Deltaproteobacteria bacterium]